MTKSESPKTDQARFRFGRIVRLVAGIGGAARRGASVAGAETAAASETGPALSPLSSSRST